MSVRYFSIRNTCQHLFGMKIIYPVLSASVNHFKNRRRVPDELKFKAENFEEEDYVVYQYSRATLNCSVMQHLTSTSKKVLPPTVQARG